jgi:hypothetical protein
MTKSAPSPAYTAIAAALEELDRADRAKLAAEIRHEEAERAVFAAIGRAVGPGRDPGLDDAEVVALPDAGAALDEFLKAHHLVESLITYSDAMRRARDADWIAGAV